MSKIIKSNSAGTRKKPARIMTVKQIVNHPDYSWATNAYLRHIIFNAAERKTADGKKIPGNGFAPAVIRIGGKILIDMDLFDAWVERHRMQSVHSEQSLHCNTKKNLCGEDTINE